MSDYLKRCPNCIELPKVFPVDCAGEVLAGLKEWVSTHDILDKKCFAHCGWTLASWGVGLYVGDDAMYAGSGATPDIQVAIDQLDLAVKSHQGGQKFATAVDWRVIASVVISIIKQILNIP